MREHFEREGRFLGYHVRPAASREDGTLVLLHAFPLASDMWEQQLAAAPGGWRVVAPDFAGFGQSFPVPLSATVDDDARDVLALLDHLQQDRAVVAGLSMGGYVALAVVRLARERLRGLVLADTRSEADTEEARRSRQQMLTTLDHAGTAGVVDSMMPRLLGQTTRAERPDIVRRVNAMALAQPAAGVRAAIHRLMTRPDSTPWLAAIECPTLVIVGAEDVITGPDVARTMHDRIPGAELAVLEAAGHLSNLEQPEEFNAALFDFLSSGM